MNKKTVLIASLALAIIVASSVFIYNRVRLQSQFIGKKNAEHIVLNQAKLTSPQVKRLRSQLDKKDNTWYYLIDFSVPSSPYEYEYKLDAYTGEIIRSKRSINLNIYKIRVIDYIP